MTPPVVRGSGSASPDDRIPDDRIPDWRHDITPAFANASGSGANVRRPSVL
jgi:hypothetical protein